MWQKGTIDHINYRTVVCNLLPVMKNISIDISIFQIFFWKTDLYRKGIGVKIE